MNNVWKILNLGLVFVVTTPLKSRNPFSFHQKSTGPVLVQGVIHDLDLEVRAYSDAENETQLQAFKRKSPST